MIHCFLLESSQTSHFFWSITHHQNQAQYSTPEFAFCILETQVLTGLASSIISLGFLRISNSELTVSSNGCNSYGLEVLKSYQVISLAFSCLFCFLVYHFHWKWFSLKWRRRNKDIAGVLRFSCLLIPHHLFRSMNPASWVLLWTQLIDHFCCPWLSSF